MLINAVILILQETLEAALLISVLTALAHAQRRGLRWLLPGLLAGLLLSWLYAANIETISGWFDYVGQEVVNAVLQGAIAVLLAAIFWSLAGAQASCEPGASRSSRTGFALSAALIVMLAVTREGSEIVLYLSGLVRQEDKLQVVLMGSGLGMGIGLSIGFLLFYALLGLSTRTNLRLSVILLAMFAGNMLSQAVLQLIQADWLPSSQPLWDSSNWLSEQSVFGQLLYALVGYEATPSSWQVWSYLLGFLLVLGVAALGLRVKGDKA